MGRVFSFVESFKITIDVEQGQDKLKQKMFIGCFGSHQPYHAVIQTPIGGMIGVTNGKTMDDGLMDIAFVPHELRD